LLNEPTAAAIAFGMGVQKVGVALIFDLGGGTFDVTIVRFGEDKSIAVLATDGDHELGGKDFDDALMEMGMKQFQQEHQYDILADVEALAELRQKAEKVKRDLTARESATLLVTAGGEKSKLTITREQFSAAIRPHLEGMKMTILNTLEDAKLKPQDITDVLLVGGSSRIPAVRDMVKELLGREPNTAIHPDEAVAMGAALYSAKLADSTAATPTEMTHTKRSENVPNVYDITPHSIGTTAYDDKDRKHNSIILPRGAKLPATAKQRYSTKVEGQKTARVDVNEGENEDIAFVRQIGSFTLTFPAARKANSPIDVEVWMDVSGIIRVVAVDVLSNKHEEITIDYTVNMNQAEVEDRAGWLKDQNIG
jgi:molecular chaperone DnaK